MRETSARTLTKALTWQVLGALTMVAIVFALTGSLLEAGGISLALQAVGLVCYILHERVWARIPWGLVTHGGRG